MSFIKPTHQKPQLIIFDVGHGLAVLLTDGNHHVLYDTGYASGPNSAFSSYIYPSLQQLGIKRLDLLILSHQDNDHSGGAAEITHTMEVEQIVAGNWFNNRLEHHNIAKCEKGFKTSIGSFNLTALHPQTSQQGNNNQSCVIRVSAQNLDQNLNNKRFSVLLTGDIEKSSEYLLAETVGQDLQSTLLLAPHHGSNSSSTYPFIKMVSPEFTVYSTERYSRYNLPHPKVKKRYRDFGIKQLHTGCLGQINYDLTDMSYTFERQRQHIWRKAPCHIE